MSPAIEAPHWAGRRRAHQARATSVFSKALLARARRSFSGDFGWAADDIETAIATIEKGGHAIATVNLWLDDGGDEGPKTIVYVGGGAVFYEAECRRLENESWEAFASRSVAAARKASATALAKGRELGAPYEPLVRLSWVCENELALFDVPANLDAKPGEDPGSSSLYVGIDIRKCGAVPGYFYNRKPVPELALVPRSARLFDIDAATLGVELLPQFKRLESLGVYGADDRLLKAVASLPTVRQLRIGGYGGRDLAALSPMRWLEHLSVAGCPKLTGLRSLERQPALRSLQIEHLPKLTKLDDVGRLTQLRSFGMHGLASQFQGIPVDSFAPLAKLRHIRLLALEGVKPRDRSIRPLLGLKTLEELWVSATFSMTDFAALSVAHPTVRPGYNTIWWNEPAPVVTEGFLSQIGKPCKKCKRYIKGRTMGSPTKYLCPDCDAAKVAKFQAAWDAAVASASRGTTRARARARRA